MTTLLGLFKQSFLIVVMISNIKGFGQFNNNFKEFDVSLQMKFEEQHQSLFLFFSFKKKCNLKSVYKFYFLNFIFKIEIYKMYRDFIISSHKFFHFLRVEMKTQHKSQQTVQNTHNIIIKPLSCWLGFIQFDLSF